MRSELEAWIHEVVDGALHREDREIACGTDLADAFVGRGLPEGAGGGLAALVGDPRPQVRALAVDILEARPLPEALDALLHALDTRAVPPLPALAAVGAVGDERASGLLVRHLGLPDRRVAGAAARALGELALAVAVGPLIDAAWRGVPEAATALGDIGGDVAAAGLLELVDCTEPLVRAAAATGLARLAETRALAQLHAHLETLAPTDPSAGAIIEAVGALGDATSFERLVRILGDRKAPVLHSHAAIALGLLGDRRAIPALSAAREAMHPEERHPVDEALARLGR